MANDFSYDAVKSLYPVVHKLIAAIRALPKRDWSSNVQSAITVVDNLAKESGFGWVWTAEERAVSSALKQVFCGPRTAHYAWRLYAHYRQCGQLASANVSY